MKPKLITAALVLLMTSGVAVAETPREKCLSNIDRFFNDRMLHDPEMLKKRDIVGDAHWDSYLLLLKTDTRFLCQKENLDEAIAVAYAEVCPRSELCDKMKALVDRGLSAEQKRCVENVITDVLNMDNETRKQIWSTYSNITPEGYVALIAVAGKCKGG